VPLGVLLLALVVGTGTLGVHPAAASASVEASASIGREPTAEELHRQDEQLKNLAARAREQAGDVRTAQHQLQLSALTAGAALERYTSTLRHLQTLQSEEDTQLRALEDARADVETKRRELGRWARQTYAGGPLAANPTLSTLFSASSTDQLDSTLQVLRRIGTGRSHTVNAVRRAESVRARAAEAAAAASEQAAAVAVRAAADRDAADTAVRAQRRLLGQAEADLGLTQTDATAVRERRAALSARLAAGGTGSDRDNRVTGTVGDCRGEAVEQYPNGQIPLSALCSLATAPDHHLRADAAFAFDRMAAAYATHFGTGICVTDSYRSLAEQLALYARKPRLAARPGTSNHGWGTATDLCGGIQRFGSAQHLWMAENAPAYGWFPPAWAQEGGSRPEPWHWEYGG
jgi:hypothetical protein